MRRVSEFSPELDFMARSVEVDLISRDGSCARQDLGVVIGLSDRAGRPDDSDIGCSRRRAQVVIQHVQAESIREMLARCPRVLECDAVRAIAGVVRPSSRSSSRMREIKAYPL